MTQQLLFIRTGVYERSVDHLQISGTTFFKIKHRCYSCTSTRARIDLLHSFDCLSDDYKRAMYERERLCTW